MKNRYKWKEKILKRWAPQYFLWYFFFDGNYKKLIWEYLIIELTRFWKIIPLIMFFSYFSFLISISINIENLNIMISIMLGVTSIFLGLFSILISTYYEIFKPRKLKNKLKENINNLINDNLKIFKDLNNNIFYFNLKNINLINEKYKNSISLDYINKINKWSNIKNLLNKQIKFSKDYLTEESEYFRLKERISFFHKSFIVSNDYIGAIFEITYDSLKNENPLKQKYAKELEERNDVLFESEIYNLLFLWYKDDIYWKNIIFIEKIREIEKSRIWYQIFLKNLGENNLKQMNLNMKNINLNLFKDYLHLLNENNYIFYKEILNLYKWKFSFNWNKELIEKMQKVLLIHDYIKIKKTNESINNDFILSLKRDVFEEIKLELISNRLPNDLSNILFDFYKIKFK